ncbi:MAG: hypothetical protein U9N42_08800 [Campylobacterota bacterium]|nr:hypothetical protein [Campylobacterota bacterium]
MEIEIFDKKITLQKKDRKVGGEAPSISLKMLNGEEKIVGMMADKVQVMITLPYSNSLSYELEEIVKKHSAKSLIYFISSEKLQRSVDESIATIEFKDFAMKFGVYANEETCAKAIFIINKDGLFEYVDILENVVDEFNLSAFDEALESAINFKKKGHTHENWMGV